MMDYEPAHVELFPDKRDAKDRYVNVKFEMLIKAVNEERSFNDTQFQIKQYFEHFLTSLSRFDYFVVSGAIEPKELCADFGYPVDLMTGDAREMKLNNTGVDITPFSKAVDGFLTRWQLTDIMDFMKKIAKACNQQ